MLLFRNFKTIFLMNDILCVFVTRQFTSLQLFQKPVIENMEYNQITIIFTVNHSIPLKRYASIITRHHLSWTFNIFLRSKHNATLAHFVDTHIIFAYTHDLHVDLFLSRTCKASKRIEFPDILQSDTKVSCFI